MEAPRDVRPAFATFIRIVPDSSRTFQAISVVPFFRFFRFSFFRFRPFVHFSFFPFFSVLSVFPFFPSLGSSHHRKSFSHLGIFKIGFSRFSVFRFSVFPFFRFSVSPFFRFSVFPFFRLFHLSVLPIIESRFSSRDFQNRVLVRFSV